MEKILDIIVFIKKNINNLTYDNIKNEITKILNSEINNNIFSNEDIDLILDIVINNKDLNDNTLKEIICNFKKKIKYKILISKDNENSEIVKNYNLENNVIYNKILDIFSDFGLIFIEPKQIIILWNENDLKNSLHSSIFKYNKNSNTITLDYNTENYEKNIEYIIKYVNYDILLNENNFKNFSSDIFNNFTRKFGISQIKNGYISNFQLNLYNNQTGVNNLFYKGIVNIFLNNQNKKFLLNDNKNIENIFLYFKKDLINIFKKNKNYALKLQYLFLNNKFLNNHVDIILKMFEYENPLFFELKKEKNIIKIHDYQKDKNTFYEIKIKCPHEDIINNYFKNQENYFKDLENFLNENIIYENDLAVCKICGEIIVNLNIKELNEYDSSKYVAYLNNVLDYPPYNTIFNSKYYFDNFFFLFNNYTKITFINNLDYLIKICLDNFIYISSKRLELEYNFKEDILNNNIFFIRFSNNFFEIDIEKEKFSEKKNVFIYFLIIITLSTFLTIRDYNHLIFIKKIINLKKINKNNRIDFDDILTLLIIFLFKNLNIEYYNNEKNKFNRINRTIKIYKEIINDELKFLYNNKAESVENFIINKQNIDYNLYINFSTEVKTSSYTDLNENGQYILSLKNIYNNYIYNSNYNFFSLYNLNIIKNNQIIYKHDENIFIDFYELNKFDINQIDKKNKTIYLNVIEELKNIKFFIYEDKKYIIKSLSEQEIIKNVNVIKENNINYVSSAGVLINDLSENINTHTENYITENINKNDNNDNNNNNNVIIKKSKIDNESILVSEIGGKKNTNSLDDNNYLYTQDENLLNKEDDYYILISNNKSIFKKYIEIENVLPDTNSKELIFFLNGDKYIFKKNINKTIFLEIIEEFIKFIKIFFNIDFKTNYNIHFSNNYYNYNDKNVLIKIKMFIILFLIKKNKIKEDYIFEYNQNIDKKYFYENL